MNDYLIKAKTAIGTAKKTSGKIERLKTPFSFRDLKGDFKGKILICPAEISKSILEKARALGVAALVCRQASEDLLSYLKEDLKVNWLSSSFVLLVVEEEIEKILEKIEGQPGIIDLEKKKLIISKT